MRGFFLNPISYTFCLSAINEGRRMKEQWPPPHLRPSSFVGDE